MTDPQRELDEAKALCKEGETEAEHLTHKERLEAAYRAFSQDPSSNPAPAGITEVSAHVVVQSDCPM